MNNWQLQFIFFFSELQPIFSIEVLNAMYSLSLLKMTSLGLFW